MSDENEILGKTYDQWRLENNEEEDAQELSRHEKEIFELTFKLNTVKRQIDGCLPYELQDLLEIYYKIRKELEEL